MKIAVPLLLVLACCGSVADASNWTGQASYYRLQGRTASGGHVQPLSAAHRTLPFGSRIRVTNLRNNRQVIVTVTDRGPFVRDRVVDVSAAAADALGFLGAGVARVLVESLADESHPAMPPSAR